MTWSHCMAAASRLNLASVRYASCCYWQQLLVCAVFTMVIQSCTRAYGWRRYLHTQNSTQTIEDTPELKLDDMLHHQGHQSEQLYDATDQLNSGSLMAKPRAMSSVRALYVWEKNLLCAVLQDDAAASPPRDGETGKMSERAYTFQSNP